MWYKLKNSLKKLENKSALTSLWSILGFTPKIFTSKTTVWFHGWQFGVKVIGNVRHCIPPSLSLWASCPSIILCSSFNWVQVQVSQDGSHPSNFGHSSHSWLISLCQVIHRIGCWKRRKRKYFLEIYLKLCPNSFWSGEMDVASLESGHSTEVISFKGDNFAEVSIKLYPCSLTINTLSFLFSLFSIKIKLH